jgi:hypothetical protein
MTNFLIFALLIGVALFGFGVLNLMAQGMSDSPGTSDPRGSCLAIVVGVVVFVVAAITMIVRLF